MAQENKYYLALDMRVRLCSDVVMSLTRHISIRVSEKILGEIDAEAARLKTSRAWVISRRLENSIKFPLYSINAKTGAMTRVEEMGVLENGQAIGSQKVEGRGRGEIDGGGVRGKTVRKGGRVKAGLSGDRDRAGGVGAGLGDGAGVAGEPVGGDAGPVTGCPECGALGGVHQKGCAKG